MSWTLTDLSHYRKDFPILKERVNGVPLVYLDHGATAPKPQVVLDAVESYLAHTSANIHRGVHALSQKATALYEDARETTREFINAAETAEIIFTKGCTESINLVASSWGRKNLQPGDEILVSVMEHHSNIVPWQLIAEERGAKVLPIPMFDNGELDLDAYRSMLSERTKMVGIVHISNSLGTINPVDEIIRLAHGVGAKVLVDGAQAGPHATIDVLAIDADFYTLSCHKAYAPTGVGVLYGKRALLEEMPPYQGGGDMIRTVAFEGSTYAPLPSKFEAGTPNIAGVIGLGAALRYLLEIGRERIAQAEHELLQYAEGRLSEIPNLVLRGTAVKKSSLVSFTMKEVHPHDLGSLLDAEGIAVRTGHHCCMPVMKRLGVPATVRATFSFINTKEEIDHLTNALIRAREKFV